MTSASDLLRLTGEALYGPQWQSALARELYVSDRTMRRWASGTHEPPPSIWQAIREIVDEHYAALDALRYPLAQAAMP